MLWLLARQCVETWQIFRNFNLFLVISFEYFKYEIYYFGKERPNGKKSRQRKFMSMV
jgi:hypothetical protein